MEKTRMTLEEFILSEMKKRDMSIRQFAEYIGVSQPTISRFLSDPQETTVGIHFLISLAHGTQTDLASIVAMAYPEYTGITAEARILAERITQLPPEQFKMIETMLMGFGIDVPKKTANDPDLIE